MFMNCLSCGFSYFIMELIKSMLFNITFHFLINSFSGNSVNDLPHHLHNSHIFLAFSLIEFEFDN